MRILRLIVALISLALSASAVVRNVPADHATIQAAHDAAAAGDVIVVQAGTYNERVTWTNDGTLGNYIIVRGVGAVIMRGFEISSASYVKFINLEITHTASTWSRAYSFSGTGSNIEILDNYIHNTYNEGGAIRSITGTYSFVTIRGNTFYHLGYVDGVFTNGNSMAVQIEETNDHWLFEYNNVERAGDFVDMDGGFHVIRNNWIHDYADAYWTSGAGHADIFQPFIITNQIYEANLCGDNIEANSHLLQIRDPGDGLIFRGNVGYNFGSYPMQCSAMDGLRHYNNTFYDFCNVSAGTPFGFDDEGADVSTDNLFINNLIHTVDATVLVSFVPGASATVGNNLSYLAPTTGGGVTVTSDPLFVSIASKQFWLQGGSPAINAGRAHTTVTSSSSSGTSFDVADARCFTDGMGVVGGDRITVGTDVVTITGITGNTLTVTPSFAWTNGENVFWGTDTTPDIGSFPASHIPLSAATYTLSGSDYTVTPTGDTRFVVFSQDGIPHTVDSVSPFTASIASGVVAMKAYPLYASQTLSVVATPAGGGSITADTLTLTTLNVQ